jgi:hypothetical protein
MTTRTRRALVRVQHAARRLARAVQALEPQDKKALPWNVIGWAWSARAGALVVDRGLTKILGPDAPTEREKFAASRDPEDVLMEARDVASNETQEDLT